MIETGKVHINFLLALLEYSGSYIGGYTLIVMFLTICAAKRSESTRVTTNSSATSHNQQQPCDSVALLEPPDERAEVEVSNTPKPARGIPELFPQAQSVEQSVGQYQAPPTIVSSLDPNPYTNTDINNNRGYTAVSPNAGHTLSGQWTAVPVDPNMSPSFAWPAQQVQLSSQQSNNFITVPRNDLMPQAPNKPMHPTYTGTFIILPLYFRYNTSSLHFDLNCIRRAQIVDAAVPSTETDPYDHLQDVFVHLCQDPYGLMWVEI